jgi:hypothetical protein
VGVGAAWRGSRCCHDNNRNSDWHFPYDSIHLRAWPLRAAGDEKLSAAEIDQMCVRFY